MAIVFSRSIRSIETDSYRRSRLTLLVAFALTAVWAGWFVFARVAVIEVADTARLEVDQAAHSVEAPVAGRITVTRLALGQEVRAGDVLLELDAESLRLSLNEQRAKNAAFAPQVAALTQEIAAEEQALEQQRRVAQTKTDESNARQREAETAAALAESEKGRASRLHAEGLGSEADAVKARAEADQRRAAAEGVRASTARIDAERRTDETERHARVARLRRSLAQINGEAATSAASIKQLEYEIDRRLLRAPIAGRLGEVATVRVGGVVREGEKLGAIIPDGNVRVVAEYQPSTAVGRVRPGQTAKMRPDGFPWTQYGMLSAVVRRVANEPRSGRIRVELDVDAKANTAIPIQHGLPGTLEIEVERVSPAALVFRAAGRRVAAPVRTNEVNGSGDSPQTPDRP